MVVATKTAVNLSLPDEVRTEFDALTKPLKAKQKWLAHTAAMLALLNLPADVREALMSKVASADAGFVATFEQLIAQCGKGELLADVTVKKGSRSG